MVEKLFWWNTWLWYQIRFLQFLISHFLVSLYVYFFACLINRGRITSCVCLGFRLGFFFRDQWLLLMVIRKKTDPKAQTLKAAKAMKSGPTFKKKTKKIEHLLHFTGRRNWRRGGTQNTLASVLHQGTSLIIIEFLSIPSLLSRPWRRLKITILRFSLLTRR